jgi:Nucleoside diphosphate kinase
MAMNTRQASFIEVSGLGSEGNALSRIPFKVELYGCEPYLREALADAQDILAERLIFVLHRAALVLIKPEGLAGGKAKIIVDYLRAHGFAIVAVALPSLSRLQWRELWRYQLTAATLDRLAVNDLILQDKVLVLLLRHGGPLDLPATVWLGSLKGPSDISVQPPTCLRRLLDQPNRLFSFFHVADEPADILRELAILFDGTARMPLLSRLGGGGGGQLSKQDAQLLDDTLAASERAARVFDATASIERVAQAVPDDVSNVAAARIRAGIAKMRRGERIEWRPFVQAVMAARLDVERWDLATLGATFIVYDEPGASKAISSVNPKAWLG